MRKMMSLLAALLLLGGLACPVLAAQSVFVPSVSYKDGPEMEDAVLDGENVGGCLAVTTIMKALDETTDILPEDREVLLELYEKLENGTMKLPLEGDYVIRELVYVSWQKNAFLETQRDRMQWLAEEGNTLSVKFDLGFRKSTDVVVLAYRNGEWEEVESVVNSSNGTVTAVFEDVCPVAFCVKRGQQMDRPETGDPAVDKLPVYMVTMAVSGVALIGLLIWRGKKRK